MKTNINLKVVNCKRCGKKITTLLPIVSNKQCICADCCTMDEKYQILEKQAEIKDFKK